MYCTMNLIWWNSLAASSIHKAGLPSMELTNYNMYYRLNMFGSFTYCCRMNWVFWYMKTKAQMPFYLKYLSDLFSSWFLSPAAEIDHVSSLFQEKQAELQSAVVRVDQVTWRGGDQRVIVNLNLFGQNAASASCIYTLLKIVLPVDSTVGRSKKRTPSNAFCSTTSWCTHGTPWHKHWPERITPVRPCSPGTEEALPGAAGRFNFLIISLSFQLQKADNTKEQHWSSFA